ncbi:MAG: hypothetical protein H6799_02885 [Candidatus Nomurabacteria bacterium]|nr:MAG: hypothetical protein H6799_02885 [Candidatus Nomurabacteria bacterium]HRV76312.1 hypothetical protein [Candidatus Saccharimonadales bacterium]
MRRTKKLEKELIEELEKTGIISSACGKVRLPRATFYRWYNEDLEFRFKINEAIQLGRFNMVDFAESKLFKNIEGNNQRAIEFYLKNNSDIYRSMNSRDYNDALQRLEDKNRKTFGFLYSLEEYLWKLVPTEVLEKKLIEAASQEEKKQKGTPVDEEVNRLLSAKYISHIFGRSKK